MATYDHTTGQGTAGHPSRSRGVYVLEKTVDIAAVCSPTTLFPSVIPAVKRDLFSPSIGGTAIRITTVCDSPFMISFKPIDIVFLRIIPAISFECFKRDERFFISIRGNRKIPSNYTKGFTTS